VYSRVLLVHIQILPQTPMNSPNPLESLLQLLPQLLLESLRSTLHPYPSLRLSVTHRLTHLLIPAQHLGVELSHVNALLILIASVRLSFMNHLSQCHTPPP
jgi:hypothetical protein